MAKEIKVTDLSVSYKGEKVLDDINFTIKKGNLIGIIGPNGAGKSTLIKAILGLIKKDSGSISVFDKNLNDIRKEIAYLPQRTLIDWDFPITVFDTVLIGTYPKLGVFKRPGRTQKEIAYESLKTVQMEKFANRQISDLSGGQQQRVFLARALAQKAEIFFLDEPFVGVDVVSEELIINILKKLSDEGKTIFVVHHDLTTVKDYFNELIILNKKLIKAGPVQDVFKEEFITEAYKAQYLIMKEVGLT